MYTSNNTWKIIISSNKAYINSMAYLFLCLFDFEIIIKISEKAPAWLTM